MGPFAATSSYFREKHLRRWLTGYAKHAFRNSLSERGKSPRHLMLALCDHFEPLWGDGASDPLGDDRVRQWEEGYPTLAAEFRDADGRPPRHTFFFPGEQYRPRYLERLARLASRGLGEVELHLHHDGDTPDSLVAGLRTYLERFAEHGHLSRDGRGGLRYAFIHGNWCLANARSDGRFCGVDSELPLLFETGCYADFTFPAAPDESQPGIVNQLYWPSGDLHRGRAYETGIPCRVGERKRDRLLIVQGPLALRWRMHRVPITIENGELSAANPATASRIRTWVRQNIHVRGRPEWVFVKLHAHGAPEEQARSLLGSGGRALHEALAAGYNDGHRWALHYVTAREMFNIAVAAMEGRAGDPNDYRDYAIPPPPVRR